MKPTVSIVTISQWVRFPCLEHVRDCLKEQTYDSIVEWVLVEGSKTKEDAQRNAEAIRTLDTRVPIVYIPYTSEQTNLGELRNIGNRTCKGDITVVMDDDDYYPPQRVKHAVEALSKSKAKLAGCSAMYMYDYFLGTLFQWNEFGPNHSTNNCMAWKKEYVFHHSHDPTKSSAEEASFTNGFQEPMVQLDPNKTIVASSHDGNTFRKREMLIGGFLSISPTVRPVTNRTPHPHLARWTQLFVKEAPSPYDIVYMTGGFCQKWNPTDASLGGSEQAVVHLAKHWVRQGKKVAVYGEVPTMVCDGVDYMDWRTFPFHHTHSILILWRLYGLSTTAPFPLRAKHIWFDCHDNLSDGAFLDAWRKYGNVVHKIFFKSAYHKQEFQTRVERVSEERCVVLPNGIRTDLLLANPDNVPRNPYRFCYCSCYTRGLESILRFLWPLIYRLEPRAELHVYYGMDGVKNDAFRQTMTALLAQPGVMDHGRQPIHILVREKYMSTFHLYISQTTAEVDCISIRESLVTGTIPLLSDWNVFRDRPGVHFSISDQRSYQRCSVEIVQLFRQPERLEAYRTEFRQSPLIVDWDTIAKQWHTYAL